MDISLWFLLVFFNPFVFCVFPDFWWGCTWCLTLDLWKETGKLWRQLVTDAILGLWWKDCYFSYVVLFVNANERFAIFLRHLCISWMFMKTSVGNRPLVASRFFGLRLKVIDSFITAVLKYSCQFCRWKAKHIYFFKWNASSSIPRGLHFFLLFLFPSSFTRTLSPSKCSSWSHLAQGFFVAISFLWPSCSWLDDYCRHCAPTF